MSICANSNTSVGSSFENASASRPKPAERIGDGSDEAAGLKLLDVLLDRRADVLVWVPFANLVASVQRRTGFGANLKPASSLSVRTRWSSASGAVSSPQPTRAKAPASAMSGSHRKKPHELRTASPAGCLLQERPGVASKRRL